MAKRKVLLVDDMFGSSDAFWRVHAQSRANFERGYDLDVFPYPPEASFHDEFPKIQAFLRAQSGVADVLIVDMMFPDEDRGGLKILDFFRKELIDIGVVLVASSTHDQGIAHELAGLPFVHRERGLDLDVLSAKLDTLFAERSLEHPERGILITHGTDTLSFVVEVLRYGLRGCQRTNVIVTGSQIPMNLPGAASDAIDNVRSSVLLLQHLYAPELGIVFNRGENYFRYNVQKVAKWHPITFEGESVVELDWDRFKTNCPDVKLHNSARPLEELILVRTGGTIESVQASGRGYVPGGDFVASFITSNLATTYRSFSAVPFRALDSSNLTIDDWIALLELLARRCGLDVDARFEPRIGFLLPSPFHTTEDYASWISRFEGLVIPGYGAGNGNILENSNYSLLKAVEEVAARKPVVLASQVPREHSDFAYEVGRRFVEAGCIPAGHLSFQASAVRLSYLLGHRETLGLRDASEIRQVFVQGIQFRSDESARACAEIVGTGVERLAMSVSSAGSNRDPVLRRRDALQVAGH